MKTPQELQKDFREKNASIIEKYEHSVKLFRDEEKQKGKIKEEKDSKKREMLERAGFDTKLIEKIQAEDYATFQKKINVARPGLINRQSELSSELQSGKLYTDLLGNSDHQPIKPFGSCIMAADQKLVENIKGEHGNPWVFPLDPSQIKIKAQGHIGGWTCWQAYGSAPPPKAFVWFHFVPDRTGLWDFYAALAFHGFYILRADDSWYNCRSAHIKLSVSMSVFQYSWQPVRRRTLLERSVSNADLIKLYDSTEWFDTSAVLRAGDDVWILAEITLEAMSYGGGTASELNFQEGNGNYILPLLVLPYYR